ncbi:hypothetical protein ASJ35_03810 [Ruthenibacterium lactatiformans]|uniref:Uncharacterized protein n=1 Tax=Ruthenibacterium lactatiformans TaxID=1550024 RepID=A0A0W7TU98_9FIRM|nr:hypothetical protein ASJ35_03810 [Ruthenibacterium lactatiformans]
MPKRRAPSGRMAVRLPPRAPPPEAPRIWEKPNRPALSPPPGRAPLLCANAPLRLVRGRKMGYNKSAYDARLSSARFLVKEKSYEIL